jgi:hypothetical protein
MGRGEMEESPFFDKMVWIISPDYGTDGLGDPIVVIADETMANRLYAVMTEHPASASYKLTTASLWRMP